MLASRRTSFVVSLPANVVDAHLRSFISVPTRDEQMQQLARENALREEGAQREREKIEPLIRAIDAAAGGIKSASQRFEASSKAHIIQLSKAIAEEVLHREVDAGHYNIPAIVDECLAIARGGDRGATICLNPVDYETALAGDLLTMEKRPNIKLREDATVERGCCRVETPYGDVVRDVNDVVADVFAAVDGRR
ncbi:MAG: FliH/SctL family protein [Planctomycetota bacterium]